MTSAKPVNPMALSFRRGSMAPPKLSIKGGFNPPNRALSVNVAKSVPLKRHFQLMGVELKQDFEINKRKIQKMVGEF